MIYTLEDYLVRLHDGQWFGWTDSKNKVYDNVVVYSNDPKPTEQECIDGVATMQAEYDAQEYARNRAKEYPAMEDYLDGVVKGDQAQIDKYIADCLAVKEKYPK